LWSNDDDEYSSHVQDVSNNYRQLCGVLDALKINNSRQRLQTFDSDAYCIGNKKDNIQVIYTPWSNLKKTGDMATGQVSFHKSHLVRACRPDRSIKG